MLNIFLISDSTGETAEQLARAALAQFNNINYDFKRFSNIREFLNLSEILNNCKETENSILFYSLVDTSLLDYTKKFCELNSITSVDLLSASILAIQRVTNSTPGNKPGALRKLNEEYFKRIDSIEFAVRYDDGKDPRGLLIADLVIIGISRTSKTPLSMYLANKNIRVANVPLVPETPVPEELFQISPKKVIGLTNSLEKLESIRKERLKSLGLPDNSIYSNSNRILEELEYSDRIMKKVGCPIINVSNKAIEETAEIILKHLLKINK
ncbi:MAG: kinase/pyrophosphorylase [Peptoniphilaceae bacterium]|uniref:pyruvate, water dikinase regulatory protein n=1 Tax=Parvimonas sp. TaxID=1944660 RepID=UPI0025D35063|nr:pyruvate, water dikinase regulatory protein [Parvimonas sp.]MCI5997912.1 kinase/pyrophosphorylase [Parvimonas sp.]MDD7764594.1 kinase/pyrophosphorylase [Peptoniphilaceae bacterium]MDY3050570.1 pyruvate, water dikinase regulatory protein [Parvimonas sp.]